MGGDDAMRMGGMQVASNALNTRLATIADQLTDLAGEMRTAAGGGERREWLAPATLRSNDNLLNLAVFIYDQRRRRCAVIGGPELFGEPAWDILLDLYIAHARGKNVSVSSACIGSAAPPTTGLRWLGILQDEGLVLREADPRDHRRVNVRLSDEGIARMETYLRDLRA